MTGTVSAYRLPEAGIAPSPDGRALVLLVRVPDNPGALVELETALRDGGLDALREALSWAARVAESAIKVEIECVESMKGRCYNGD